MEAADIQEKPRKSKHMVERQEQRNITDEEVEAALQGECVAGEDGSWRHNGANGVVLIRDSNDVLLTTYESSTIGLAVITTPRVAAAVCAMSSEHVCAGVGFPRSRYAECVGSGVVGLMALDVADDTRDNDTARKLIPEEFYKFAESKNIEGWERCGYNSDWQRLYEPDPASYEHLSGASLLSGVELPNPLKGYPNLDILRLLAKTHGTSDVDEILDRLQQRAVVEAGVAVHRQFLKDRPFERFGFSEHVRHQGLPVCYVTTLIPVDAQVVEIMVDDDWALRLESYYYPKVSERVVTNTRFAAIVPADFDIANLHQPTIRNCLLPMSKEVAQIIPCQDCENNKLFTWTKEQQQRYEQRRWESPKRCLMHQAAQSSSRSSVRLNCTVCAQSFTWFMKSQQQPPSWPRCRDCRKPRVRGSTTGTKAPSTPDGPWR